MRIMLDECILNNKLQTAFEKTDGFEVCSLFDLGFQSGEKDENLVAGTTEHERLLLTTDKKTITEKKYPPCHHGGIVQFKRCESRPEYVIPRLQALRKLNLEEKAVGHFTYIYYDKIKVVTHTETIEKHFKDYEELRDI